MSPPRRVPMVDRVRRFAVLLHTQEGIFSSRRAGAVESVSPTSWRLYREALEICKDETGKEAAHKLLETSLTESPEFVTGMKLMCDIKMQSAEYNEATQYLSQLLAVLETRKETEKTHGTIFSVCFNLAVCAYHRQKYSEALTLLRGLLRARRWTASADPCLVSNAEELCAFCLFRLGDVHKSSHMLVKGLPRNPKLSAAVAQRRASWERDGGEAGGPEGEEEKIGGQQDRGKRASVSMGKTMKRVQKLKASLNQVEPLIEKLDRLRKDRVTQDATPTEKTTREVEESATLDQRLSRQKLVAELLSSTPSFSRCAEFCRGLHFFEQFGPDEISVILAQGRVIQVDHAEPWKSAQQRQLPPQEQKQKMITATATAAVEQKQESPLPVAAEAPRQRSKSRRMSLSSQLFSAEAAAAVRSDHVVLVVLAGQLLRSDRPSLVLREGDFLSSFNVDLDKVVGAEPSFVLSITSQTLQSIMRGRPAIRSDQERVYALKCCRLLASFTPTQIATLAACAVVLKLEMGEVVLKTGDPPRGLYIILRGRVVLTAPEQQSPRQSIALRTILGSAQSGSRVSVSPRNKKSRSEMTHVDTGIPVGTLLAGDCFGHACVRAYMVKSSVQVSCVDASCELLLVPRKVLIALMEQHANVKRVLTHTHHAASPLGSAATATSRAQDIDEYVEDLVAASADVMRDRARTHLRWLIEQKRIVGFETTPSRSARQSTSASLPTPAASPRASMYRGPSPRASTHRGPSPRASMHRATRLSPRNVSVLSQG